MNLDYYWKLSLLAKNGHMPTQITFKIGQASKDIVKEEIRKDLNMSEQQSGLPKQVQA